MAFTPRLTSQGLYDGTIPYYIPVSQYNPFENYDPVTQIYGNCTWYAWGRFYEESEPPTLPTLSRNNAEFWYGHSVDGYERGQTPRIGAIICYSGGNYSGDGHVAIVEQINADGTIVVSESGYAGYDFRTRVADPNNIYPYSNPTDGYTFQGFIYNPRVNTISCSPYVIASMCGCWWRESMVNPSIWESLTPKSWDYQYEYTNVGGYGLGQWTNIGTPYGRLYDLHNWVTSNGYTDGDGDGQLAYVTVEDYWRNYPSPRLGYNSLTEFLQSTSTSLPDLVYDFIACWEGVEGDAYAQRLAWANQCYNYIQQHQNDNPNDYQWISGNRYLSESETLNNVMIVYFWFTNNEPVPPIPPVVKKSNLLLYCNKKKFMRKRGLIWRL